MEYLLCTIAVLVLLLVTLSPSCIAQNDGDVETRCLLSTDGLVRVCRNYYASGSGYFNATNKSEIDDALRAVNRTFRNDNNRDNPCVDLMMNYLCHYYFPSCNVATDEITPVCSTTCSLLSNNEDCVMLRGIADMRLEEQAVDPPSDSCSVTYLVDDDDPPPTVTDNCLAIEESLNESLPLTCIEIDADETCRPQIPNSHYAPATFETTDELFSEIQSIITQLDPFNPCRVFITTVICVFRFPACNPMTGMILPICPDLCPLVDDIVMQCSLEFFRDNPEFPNVNQLLDDFVCLEPQSYYNFPIQYISTDDCSAFINGTFSTTMESPTESSSDNIGVIIGAVIAATVVCVASAIIITLLCIRHNRLAKKKYKTRQDSHNEYTEQPSAVRYYAHDDDHLGLNMTYASNAPSPYLTPRSMNLNGGIKEYTFGKRSSMQLLEVNDFLLSVRDRFSEVLLPVESITKQGLLGKGAFGVVHKGELKACDGTLNKTVAIKTIKSSSLDAMKDLVAESAIMKTFHHPNVLPLLGVCIDYDDEDVLKVVMPFMANGDLRSFLKDSRVSTNNTHQLPEDLSDEILMKMCFDIAKGMEYLAEKRFIHRDLAARNCMVDKFLSIKIADFGLAKDIYSTEYYRVDKHITLPVKWMSIESLLDGYFDEKTDVWSYGVTCWEIFSLGRIPYPGVDNANVITLLKSNKRLDKPELCSLEMNELITSTWLEDPDDRPTFSQIVKDLSSICNFTEVADEEESIKDNEDTAENSGYIKVVPT